MELFSPAEHFRPPAVGRCDQVPRISVRRFFTNNPVEVVKTVKMGCLKTLLKMGSQKPMKH